MSFSSEVKARIAAGLDPLSGCCRRSALYGVLLFSGVFTEGEMRLVTESEASASAFVSLLGECFGVLAEIRSKPTKRGSESYTASVSGEGARIIFLGYGHSPPEVSKRINRAVFECDECGAAFVSGAFLASGFVGDPAKGYHLEFVTPGYQLSRDLTALIGDFSLYPKTMVRKSNYVVYFKHSDDIEDMLALMGAAGAAFDLMNVKIEKDIRNLANRQTNFETANLKKTVMASMVQIEAIERIISEGDFEALSPELREAAEARLSYPEYNLAELTEVVPGISRSGLNHRLARLVAIAKRYEGR